MDMFPGPFRHLSSDVVSDLVTSILVAVAAVIATRLLDHMGCSLSDGGQRRYPPTNLQAIRLSTLGPATWMLSTDAA